MNELINYIFTLITTIITINLLLTNCIFGTQESNNKIIDTFCMQHHFDSVYFDGTKYQLIVTDYEQQQKIFSVQFDRARLLFRDFSLKIKKDSWIIQNSVYIDEYKLHIELYYESRMANLTNVPEQQDHNAYQSYYRIYTQANNSRRELCRTDRTCSKMMESYRNVLSPLTNTTYTNKFRVLCYVPKQRILWAVFEQDPLLYGYAVLESTQSISTVKWKYIQATTDSIHLITGAFVWNNDIYIVQEQMSIYGFRFPSVVKRVINITNFTLDFSFEMSLNRFFNCELGTINSYWYNNNDFVLSIDPDQNWNFLLRSMWILSTFVLVLLFIFLIIAVLLLQESSFYIQKMLMQRRQWSTPEVFESKQSFLSRLSSLTSLTSSLSDKGTSLSSLFQPTTDSNMPSSTNTNLLRDYSLLLDRNNQRFEKNKRNINKVIYYHEA